MLHTVSQMIVSWLDEGHSVMRSGKCEPLVRHFICCSSAWYSVSSLSRKRNLWFLLWRDDIKTDPMLTNKIQQAVSFVSCSCSWSSSCHRRSWNVAGCDARHTATPSLRRWSSGKIHRTQRTKLDPRLWPHPGARWVNPAQRAEWV